MKAKKEQKLREAARKEEERKEAERRKEERLVAEREAREEKERIRKQREVWCTCNPHLPPYHQMDAFLGTELPVAFPDQLEPFPKAKAAAEKAAEEAKNKVGFPPKPFMDCSQH